MPRREEKKTKRWENIIDAKRKMVWGNVGEMWGGDFLRGRGDMRTKKRTVRRPLKGGRVEKKQTVDCTLVCLKKLGWGGKRR